MFECECGFKTEDENEFLAHMIDCETEPEEKWGSYVQGLALEELPFKNSEILEEEDK